jgi:hypothetical protein
MQIMVDANIIVSAILFPMKLKGFSIDNETKRICK